MPSLPLPLRHVNYLFRASSTSQILPIFSNVPRTCILFTPKKPEESLSRCAPSHHRSEVASVNCASHPI